MRIRRFRFEQATDPGYLAIKEEAKARGLHCFSAVGDPSELPPDGAEFSPGDPKGLHSDQMTTAEGVRIFDFRVIAEFSPLGARLARRSGYILEDDESFRDVQRTRRETLTCGYCGSRKPLSKVDGEGTHWCDRCTGSEYLNAGNLPLLELRPLSEFMPTRAAPVPEWLSVEWERRQRDTAQRKAAGRLAQNMEKIEQERADLALESALITALAAAGLEWRLLDNLIHYSHSREFVFGWRDLIAPADAAKIRALIDAHNLQSFNVKIKESKA
jgi:hypothetical protein